MWCREKQAEYSIYKGRAVKISKKKVAKKKYPNGNQKPYADKGSNVARPCSSRKNWSDYPIHIDQKTGKPKKGKPGEAKKVEATELKQNSMRIQKEVLRFFEEGHLNTGDFQRWVRMSKSNTHNFYKWVIADLLPKNVALTIAGGDTDNPMELPFVVRLEKSEAK